MSDLESAALAQLEKEDPDEAEALEEKDRPREKEDELWRKEFGDEPVFNF